MASMPPQAEAEPKPNGSKHARRRRPAPRPIRALILSPTRELSAQIGESLKRYGRFTPVEQTVIYGGVSQFHQVKALQRGVDALVATPGRLLDLVNQGHVNLSKVEVLIFDEADQMLDMGFLPDLKRIVKLVPRERQTLMFSATMPPAIRELGAAMAPPPRVDRGGAGRDAGRADHAVGPPGRQEAEAGPLEPLPDRNAARPHAGLQPHQARRRTRS